MKMNFKKVNLSYKESFKKWWDFYEPFGFDHPDTYLPLKETFNSVDNEIKILMEEIDRRNEILLKIKEYALRSTNYNVKQDLLNILE